MVRNLFELLKPNAAKCIKRDKLIDLLDAEVRDPKAIQAAYNEVEKCANCKIVSFLPDGNGGYNTVYSNTQINDDGGIDDV